MEHNFSQNDKPPYTYITVTLNIFNIWTIHGSDKSQEKQRQKVGARWRSQLLTTACLLNSSCNESTGASVSVGLQLCFLCSWYLPGVPLTPGVWCRGTGERKLDGAPFRDSLDVLCIFLGDFCCICLFWTSPRLSSILPTVQLQKALCISTWLRWYAVPNTTLSLMVK